MTDGSICLDSKISIHALLAESDDGTASRITKQHFISIHALLAESDRRDSRQQPAGEISIHALLAESDTVFVNTFSKIFNFYPRSPCGERPRRRTYQQGEEHFYPRSPCGERPGTR